MWVTVVAQQMVDAQAAGVLFTGNPSSGARDEIVPDASWVWEAIVGGSVTPDHIAADKATDAIREIVIGDKAVMTTRSDTGTVDNAVTSNLARRPRRLEPEVRCRRRGGGDEVHGPEDGGIPS